MDARRITLDPKRIARDFRDLDPNDPGLWPAAPRIALCLGLVAVTVAAAWWFDWRELHAQLERRVAEEAQLRSEWTRKQRQAVALPAYRQQLEETDRQLGALVRQLPNRAEMDSLLADINQAGLGRGLLFELFKPGDEVGRDFYAEMPIEVSIVGNYHDLGAFASDVARMPRIVSLGEAAIEQRADGQLSFEARAVTYRYLDEDERAARQQANTSTPRRRR